MRRLLLFFVVLFSTQFLSAQNKFRVALSPDLKTYSVYMLPSQTLTFPNNASSGAQLGFVVPTGGFIPGNIDANYGDWALAAHYIRPEENTGADYLIFSYNNPTFDIPFVAGQEVMMFSFENIGTCTGEMTFVENENDPFWPPNSINAQIGNLLLLGNDDSINFYDGTYYVGGYGCDHLASALCGITFNGVDFTSPSSCGLSDGTLTIFAMTDSGLPLEYSIDGGDTWQSSNTFTGLTSGDRNVVIRDIASICVEDVGSINVPGPLGPLIISQELNNPDCGVDNGSITIHARTDFGDPIEFSNDGGLTFSTDSTFTGLSDGDHTFVVKNTVNLCQTIVSYTLTGCAPVECVVYYEIEKLVDGRYQVILLPDTTWLTPGNRTSNLQVTWKAPSGGFEIGDLRSEVPGVDFDINGVLVNPGAAPGFDYFSVGLKSTGTGGINYIKGMRVPLFSFSNLGDCQGGDVSLIDNMADPIISDPNQDVSQQLFTFGMGDEVPICLNENNSVPCEMTPIPCIAEFELSQTPSGAYQVSMTPGMDFTGNQARTRELRVTMKVPTGFVMDNLTESINGLTVMSAVEASNPAAAPGFDYINVSVGPLATDLIPYVNGQQVDLFTFENSGACSGDVKIMDPETDAYSSPTAGLHLIIIAAGTDPVVTCLNDVSFPDCPPVTVNRDTVYVTMTTDMDVTECVGSVLDLPNGTGTASICGNGAFVTASVSNGSDCVDLSPNGNFNQTDEICVIHCDAAMGSICDTTIIIICPQVQIAPVAPGCAGTDFQITTTGGAGNFTWTPNNASGMNPVVNLSASETYSVTADDGNGCSTTADVAITVNPLPIASFLYSGICLGKETVFTNASGAGMSYSWDFGDGNSDTAENPEHTYAAVGTYTITLTVTDGNSCVGSSSQNITISAGTSTGSYQEFTICAGDTLDLLATGGTSYSWSPSDFLSATDIANPQSIPPRSMTYLVNTSGGGGGCGATVDTFQVNVNPAPVIGNVVKDDVTDCDNPNGTIKIIASAGGDSIAYSIDCGATWQADLDFLNLDKGTYAPTVINTVTGCTSKWSDNYTVNGPAAPRLADVTFTNPTACGSKDGTITFDSPETGLEYSIDNGDSWAGTSTFSDLEGGDYNPIIRFSGGACTTPYSDNGGILSLQDAGTLPELTNKFDGIFICEDDAKSVKVSIDQTIDSYNIVSLGTYSDMVVTDSILSFNIDSPVDSVEFTVELTTAEGCSASQNFKAYKSELPTLLAREKEDTECQKSEGAFLLVVNGGTAPYNFCFTDPTGTVLMEDVALVGDQPFSDLSQGAHIVKVTDDIGCLSEMTVTIDMLPVDHQLTEEVNMPNCGAEDGSIVLSQTGGNLTFEWTDTNGTVVSNDSTLTNFGAGTYTVDASDALGCIQEMTFELVSPGTPDLEVEQTMPALCDQNNGGVSFHVNGTGAFTASIQGTEITVQGNESSMIFGLTGGTYDLIISNNDTGCETIQSVTIDQSITKISSNNVDPTDCAASDGQVCITLTDGQGPYNIVSSLGDMTAVAEGSEVCFDNVAPGIYSLEITDASGCVKTESVELVAPNQPVISVDSFAVSGLNCPDILNDGSILSMSNSIYSVEQNGTLVGLTPVTGLEPGTYMLLESVNGCIAQKEVILEGVDQWTVDTAMTPESCDENDGSIELTVSGANGGYTYEWSAGVTNVGGLASGLNADSTYSVVVIDSEGCRNELNGLKIDKDCSDDDCEPMFEVETFTTTVSSSFPQICLPLVQSNISGQGITLNGAPYGGFATVCSSDLITYDLKDLLDFATLPMTVNDWAYRNNTLRDSVFNTPEELVALMNERSPNANWRYDALTQTISGQDISFFGDIVVGHAGSSDPITVFRNEESVISTAIEIPGEGSHMLILSDDQGLCFDTLMITATEIFDGPDYPDSMSITTVMGVPSNTICKADNIQFPIDAVVTACADPLHGILTFDGNCYEYTPEPGYIGQDVFCIEVCDGNDCQQIMIRVNITGNDVIIHTGISPNGDFANDELIIENIELFAENRLKIYNRWGVVVYKAENYSNSNPWKGEFNNVMLPDGTYFIILDLISGDGSVERKTNYIQINR